MYVMDADKSGHAVLKEMTATQLAQAESSGRDVYSIDPRQARKWVANGYQHETPLYVDCDGKVRYASE